MNDTQIHGSMSAAYDPIQGQGHGDLKVANMADFKCYLLCQYACNQKN